MKSNCLLILICKFKKATVTPENPAATKMQMGTARQRGFSGCLVGMRMQMGTARKREFLGCPVGMMLNKARVRSTKSPAVDLTSPWLPLTIKYKILCD